MSISPPTAQNPNPPTSAQNPLPFSPSPTASQRNESTLSSMAASQPTSGFCQWLKNFLLRIFRCFSPKKETPTSTATATPQPQNTTTITVQAAPLPLTPTEIDERVTTAKRILNEHLNQNDPDRQTFLGRGIPQEQWGVILRLRYNAQEIVRLYPYKTPNLSHILELQLENFLRTASRQNPRGTFHIRTILVQKLNAEQMQTDSSSSMLNYQPGSITPPLRRSSSLERNLPNFLNQAIQDPSNREDIRTFFQSLPPSSG